MKIKILKFINYDDCIIKSCTSYERCAPKFYRLLGIAQNFSRERRKRLDNIFTDSTIKRERERERVEMKRKLYISFPINIDFLIISLSSPNNRTLLFIALYNDLSSFAVTNPLKIFNAVFINTLLLVSSSSSSSWT